MKRTVTIVMCLFVSVCLAGEKADQVVVSPIAKHLTIPNNLSAQGDTLFQNFFSLCTPSLFSSTSGGFVGGNNQFGDLEKAQKYEGTGGGSVTEFVIWVGEKTVGSNGNVVGVIYDADGTGGSPGTVLGTSNPVAMSDVIASQNPDFTTFIFSTPVSVGDNFFCSVVLSQSAGDTIGIITTENNCLAGANTTANAWELFSDGVTWVPFDNAISWQLVVDLGIFPVMEIVTSVDENSDQVPSSFALDQNYPNPFNPSTKIAFSLPQNSEVTLKVYNLLGQEVATLLDNAPHAAGRHNFIFDASQLTNGIYFYKIEAENFVDIKKMTLIK